MHFRGNQALQGMNDAEIAQGAVCVIGKPVNGRVTGVGVGLVVDDEGVKELALAMAQR